MKVLVIGDVIDDIILVPNQAIRPNTDTTAKINHTYGGSAANIACWAAHNGADVSFVGCVNDKDAERFEAQFATFGVKTFLQLDKKETGTLVSIVEGPSRTMLTDRGANTALSLESLRDSFIQQFSFVFISGYALFGKPVQSIIDFMQRVKHLGCKVLVDPGSVGFIQDFGVKEFKNAIEAVDILLPNHEEFEILGSRFETVIVTKGEAGVDLYQAGKLVESFAVQKLEAIDPTGAGDSFSGAVLASLANGEDLSAAIAAGISSAAQAVMTIGARPQL